jgi:hypothetical protein
MLDKRQIAMLVVFTGSVSMNALSIQTPGGNGGVITLYGCISQDKNAKGYVLKNERYKRGITVTGSDDFSDNLKADVGNTVKLTGHWEGTGKFRADGMEKQSDNCSTSTKSADQQKDTLNPK